MSEKKTVVYYVEDEPDLIELCEIAFQTSGIEMKSALTGEEAMDLLGKISSGKEKIPDAFILDVLLPGVSGMEIMREIRKDSKFDGVPIIIFTNYSDTKIREETKNTANAEYVLKTDVIPTQLVKIVLKRIEEAGSK